MSGRDGHVVTILPIATTPEQKVALIDRAIGLSEGICSADRESFSPRRATLEIVVEERAVLARAVELLVEKLDDLMLPPKAARCVWCWQAAGGTEEAWHALPPMTIGDETLEHAKHCKHNPERAAVIAYLIDLCWKSVSGSEATNKALRAAADAIATGEHRK
jgi:hypothetical protein